MNLLSIIFLGFVINFSIIASFEILFYIQVKSDEAQDMIKGHIAYKRFDSTLGEYHRLINSLEPNEKAKVLPKIEYLVIAIPYAVIYSGIKHLIQYLKSGESLVQYRTNHLNSEYEKVRKILDVS